MHAGVCNAPQIAIRNASPGIGLRECPNFSRNTPAIAIQHVGQEAIAGDNLSSTVRGRDKHWQFAGSGL
jgi:hypothetical protein